MHFVHFVDFMHAYSLTDQSRVEKIALDAHAKALSSPNILFGLRAEKIVGNFKINARFTNTDRMNEQKKKARIKSEKKQINHRIETRNVFSSFVFSVLLCLSMAGQWIQSRMQNKKNWHKEIALRPKPSCTMYLGNGTNDRARAQFKCVWEARHCGFCLKPFIAFAVSV